MNTLKEEIPRRLVFLILCLLTISGLFLRIKYIEQTVIVNPIRADATQYVIYGYNLKNYGTFSRSFTQNPTPDSFRSPGYPILIALGMIAGGDKGFYWIVLYTQAVIGTGLVPLTFLLGRRFLPLHWAITSSALTAFSPHLVSMTSYLLTETLFSFILLSAILVFCIAIEKQNLFLFIFGGLAFGFAYSTNETALFLPPIFAGVIMLIPHCNKSNIFSKKTVTHFFCFLIVFSLFPIFWMWRSHNFVPEESRGTKRAIATMSHGAYPGFVYQSERFKYFPYKEDPMQPAFGSSLDNFLTILEKRVKEDPLKYLTWYILQKPYYIWSWNILQGQGDIYVYPVRVSFYQTNAIANLSKILMKHLHFIFLIATLIGVVLLIREVFKRNHHPPPIIFLFSLIIYYTILSTVFAPWPRYSVPLRPEFYLFSLWSICFSRIVLSKRNIENG
jgi:4-amino-4-deoxy-L-arabinose transferase-like glycosyltransferase